jgi:hypothetical protein
MSDIRESIKSILRPRQRLSESIWDEVTQKWLAAKYQEGEQKPTADDVEMYIDKFKTLKQRQVLRGEENDILKWGKGLWSEFKEFVDAQEAKIAQVDVVKKTEKDATKVFENDKVLVVSPHTWEASKKYGKGSRWCVASESTKSHWGSYRSQGAVFYYFLSKHYPDRDKYNKVAIYALPHGGTLPKELHAYDSTDRSMNQAEAQRFLKGEGVPVNLIHNRMTFDEEWLTNKFGTNWNKNPDGSIDVKGEVNFRGLELSKIPIKFGKVDGLCNFSSTHLKSLVGCPREITGDCLLGDNEFTSLEGAPQKVGGRFELDGCRQLKTLKGGPVEVGGSYTVRQTSITDLEGMPRVVSSFDASGCHLFSLKGGPEKCLKMFTVCHNRLKSLEGAPLEVGGLFSIYNNELTTMQGCPQKVGGVFASMNQLVSLEGMPAVVPGEIDVGFNSLQSLKGCPGKVGYMVAVHNHLTTLEGGPEEVARDFDVSNNQLTNLVGCPQKVGEDFIARRNKITSTKGLPGGMKVDLIGNPITAVAKEKVAPAQKPVKPVPEESVIDRLVGEKRLDRYTVLAQWPNGMKEEVDVDAEDEIHAKKLAAVELERDYKPGWKIIHVEGPRVGWYM